MRHRKAGLKLSRTSSHRDAMFRNMVTSLFKHDRIRTTDAKAKELRRWADHLITLAKKGDLHARRQALAIVREKQIVHKLFDEASERYAGLSGGYTRVVKLGTRPGDAAPISLVELVTKETVSGKTKKKPAKAKTTPKKETATAEASPKPDKATEAAETASAEEAPAVAEPEPAAEETLATAEKTESEDITEPPEAESAADIEAEAAVPQADETEAAETETEKPKKKTAKKPPKEDEDES
jgi:large subunit ribosomal protein L17